MGTTLQGVKTASNQSTDAVPPFLTKTYDLVSDAKSNDVVSWNKAGKTFIVWKPAEFARDLLPKHFKHNNFSSFVRQLNTYGFRKVDPDKWEFSNENFRRDAKQLLKDIHRRKPAKASSKDDVLGNKVGTKALIEVGRYGVTETLDQLKRDREVLMMELVRVRQRQQLMESQFIDMQSRLERSESRQNSAEKNQAQIFNMVQQALQNPAVLQQFLSSKNYGYPYLESADSIGKRKKVKAKRPHEATTQSPVDLYPANQMQPAASTSYYFPEPTLPALPPSPKMAGGNQYTQFNDPRYNLMQPGTTAAAGGSDAAAGGKLGAMPPQMEVGADQLQMPQMGKLNLHQRSRSEGIPESMSYLEEEAPPTAQDVAGIDSFLDFGPESLAMSKPM